MGGALLYSVALPWLDCFYGDLGGVEALVVDLVLGLVLPELVCW
jgi:hypothetical protein